MSKWITNVWRLQVAFPEQSNNAQNLGILPKSFVRNKISKDGFMTDIKLCQCFCRNKEWCSSRLAEIFISSQGSLQFYHWYQSFINQHQEKNKDQIEKNQNLQNIKGIGPNRVINRQKLGHVMFFRSHMDNSIISHLEKK